MVLTRAQKSKTLPILGKAAKEMNTVGIKDVQVYVDTVLSSEDDLAVIWHCMNTFNRWWGYKLQIVLQ